jgi:hypothetical protein
MAKKPTFTCWNCWAETPLVAKERAELRKRKRTLTRCYTCGKTNAVKSAFGERLKNSRKKGHAFERWCAIEFRPLFPDVRRHLENHKDDAALGVDLVGTGRYRIQCKKLAKYAPIDRINQVKLKEGEDACPVLITQGDGLEAMAVLPLNELLRLIKIEKAHG